MLNKPGFLFRRLISSNRPRQENDDEGSAFCGEDDSMSVKTLILKQTRSTSWLPSTRKKRPSSPIATRRSRSIHRISSPLPPVPAFISQTSSSSLSLCTCDGHTDIATRNLPVKQKAASALCLTEHGRATLHSNPPKHPTWPRNAPFGEEDVVNSSAVNSPRPSISLSDHADRSKHQPSQNQAVLEHDECPEGWSENVQRLILETDEAFKAVGSALAEAKVESSLDFQGVDASAPSPVIRRHSKPMPFTPGLRKDQRSRDNVSPSPLGSPARSASVKKPSKRMAKKTRYGFARPRKPQVWVPKWTLSENVTDILTGQRFRRIEADEMVTPAQIEEFQRTREEAELNEDRLKRRGSSDSVRTTSSDKTETPAEPFHVKDLASQTEAASKEATTSHVEPAPPSVPSDCDVIHWDLSIPRNVSKNECYLTGLLGPTSPYKPKTCSLPSLPTGNSKQSSLEQTKQFPAIPEVMVTTPDNTQLQPSTHRRSHDKQSLKPEENDEFYYLKSTPYTLTRPGFRHGPITFSKAEMCKGVKPMDDTLDWTAFQMAILGAGDLSPDMSLEDDIKQEADIASWFESFGFETPGRLVSTGMVSPQCSPQSTFSSSPSTVDTDAEPPIPLGAEYPSGFWNIPSEEQSKDADKFFNNTGLKRWIAEERPRRYTSQSSDSMPTSPMMPLTVQTGLDGDEARATVPMGYNLGHDLGDFLKWEAEHAYAGGFYGSL